MGERAILAYFNSPEQAEGVASKLRALRVETIQIDRISHYPSDSDMGVDHVMNPINGDFPSLGSLTLNAGFNSREAAILAAADPSAYSMSGGGNLDTGRDILLTAVVNENVYEQALRVCEQSGGLV
ncbi:hypothetical protein SD70_27330 [Gordoniibacillus kamchatkensis]|uniref:General stress protein 17M-like domain-containing protein n=1 Tax=Gordoniibacillus kamchatkensis TaxID=1590651 RepID=A0ABR5AC81_9BACL|nr:hypothetical protein [Paenibacillus sp. VKM B-2647]KIL38283.1 hypothetical protein SD70_27330 [Paenibacillus sp. VKM B-2647]